MNLYYHYYTYIKNSLAQEMKETDHRLGLSTSPKL